MTSSADPFLSANRAKQYESWYRGPGRRADRLEKRLLRWCLDQFPDARTILDVGCGTGHFTRWFAEFGLDVTGLDSSPAMLRVAREHGGVRYVQGDALALPMAPRTVDLVMLITTLEFLDDPAGGLREAVRVARHGLVLGVLNRASLLGRRRRRARGPIWSVARFYTPAELVTRLREAAGDPASSIRWRTTLWPLPLVGSLPLPWGGFIGLALKLQHQPTETPT